MCGINILNHIHSGASLEKINYHCQKRGPDGTTIYKSHGITFIHNLLSITGKVTFQPFVQDNVVCLFNGEIYNYKSLIPAPKSDGECIIELFLKDGIDFSAVLDGEYSIVIFDFRDTVAQCYMITDPFGTKPLFYGTDETHFMISSYTRCLTENGYNPEQIIKALPNTTYYFKVTDEEGLILQNVWTAKHHKFDLANQSKGNYDDWCVAFENALYKRTDGLTKSLFVPMSSGYDSGAICCALNKLGIHYTTYTILGAEDHKIVKARLKINKEHGNGNIVMVMNEDLIAIEHKRNMLECSDYECNISHNQNRKKYSVLGDRALNGAGYISKHARGDGHLVSLSGQGADEILSDYGHNGHRKSWHSVFGGKFPEQLSDIVDQENPRKSKWLSFQSGSNEAFLMKEESIFGSYGIETRYPYLDKELVQEFLYLKPELKNMWFKAPIHYYLVKNKYPFKPNEKIGLNCLYAG